MGADEFSAKDEMPSREQKIPGEPGRKPSQKRGSSPLVKIAIILIVVLVIAAGALYAIDEFSLLRPVDLPQDGQETTPSDTKEPILSPVIVSFDIEPEEITAVESATLQWEVTGAENVVIDQDIGEVPVNGSMSVSPVTDTTYKLTATNEAGSTSRTVSISVMENVNASQIALTIEDVKQSDFIFDMDSEPSVDDTISTYDIRFKRFGEILDNRISIHTTVKAAEERYNNIKYNNRQEVTDVVRLGERGYVLTYRSGDPAKEIYVINFQKYNVYVSIGGISDYDELVSLAELVEERIK
jgi:hypothetical protein